MKAVILAGGQGTRLSEETAFKPKPMVEIGGMPIVWHIMKLYSHHGINDFVLCLGHLGHVIKQFFADYNLRASDVTFDLQENRTIVHRDGAERWRVTCVDTGANTLTGGRLKRIAHHVRGETFLMTYGDGVADVDIARTVEFHRSHGGAATMTAARLPGRFGHLRIADDQRVASFVEKPMGDDGYVNGGFFVLEPSVFALIDGDQSVWEGETLARLSRRGDLFAYKHDGFFQPMDHLRDRNLLEEMWRSGNPPWRVWC